MSELTNVHSDLASAKFYGSRSEQAKQQEALKQAVKQDPSTTTGIQWAQTQAVQQAQSGEQAAQVANAAKPADAKGANAQSESYDIVQPNLEDVAMLTTTVSTNESEVAASKAGMVRRFVAGRLNMGALETSYKEYFKKSKSHNLLLERFMANVKFSAMKMLMSALGVSAEEQVQMQAEVREEALKEIDSKLQNDWAYTKAMMDITG